MTTMEEMTAIVTAAGEGQTDAVLAFLDNHPEALDLKDWDGTTVLLSASWHGKLDTVKALLQRGASVTVADDQRWTPLTAAVRSKHLDVALWLVDNAPLSCDVVKQAVQIAEETDQPELSLHFYNKLKLMETRRDADKVAAIALDKIARLKQKHPVKCPFNKGPRP